MNTPLKYTLLFTAGAVSIWGVGVCLALISLKSFNIAVDTFEGMF
jgi:hypothetical protein